MGKRIDFDMEGPIPHTSISRTEVIATYYLPAFGAVLTTLLLGLSLILSASWYVTAFGIFSFHRALQALFKGHVMYERMLSSVDEINQNIDEINKMRGYCD